MTLLVHVGDVGVVLRVLLAGVHPVVPYDPDLPEATAGGQVQRPAEGVGRLVVTPRQEQDDVARAQHGVEDVPRQQARSARVQAKARGDQFRALVGEL